MKLDLILYPMFSMFLLTFCVITLGYINRVRAVRSAGLRISYFKHNSGAEPPEFMQRTDQNFTNLFETPVIFYAVIITSYITSQVDIAGLILAWAYVASRIGHSYIHIRHNNILLRLKLFLLSLFVLLALCINQFIQLIN